jgi:poly(3-hydroxybutyrate) depolymerase/outer membrane protein assembly factor BamD (BamD/ComL family)
MIPVTLAGIARLIEDMRMHRLGCVATVLFLAFASAPIAAGEKIGAGKEGKLEVPGNPYSSLIYIPSDYKDGMKLPLLLFLHGAGGSPTTWPFKTATKGEGYIIVGLAYGGEENAGKNGIHGDPKMIDYIAQVREIVKTTYGINEAQVFLTGLSMGGWGVNYYGFNKKAQGLYRGYCIIAAGPIERPGVDFSVAKDLPVLLLNGSKDMNLPAANQGKPLLEKAGAIVKQIVLEGEGHVPSSKSMDGPLMDWLKENGPLKEVLAILEKAKAAEKTGLGAALALYEQAFAACGASSDPTVKEARTQYDKLAGDAKTQWDAANALASEKKYADCVATLEKLAKTYRGHETAKKAEQKLQELRADKDVQKVLADDFAKRAWEQTTAAAEQLLTKASEKLQAKEYGAAEDLFKQVGTQFPGTPAVAKAAEQLKKMSEDPQISAALNAAVAGKESRKLLSQAKNFHNNGMNAEALDCLNQIIQKFPKSTWAAEAEKLKGEWK